ncbi:FlgN protein [Pelagirhabdus alkalitolerans]|uniref:FlgN protein n=1 Tax=Pelagirhabdus alkalitolerans TaxID=1612202 RepID=A0A1G6L4P3_9BACI|nr:flagellar protein FlgN [Pelagirhabdus alkalitolerans]SDC38184.1 FlgN protein [Pelagirhabdus alkalitolerans]
MSIESMLGSLDRLRQLHQSLLELSIKKTELLKSGDIAGLQKVLKTEQKHIQAINTVEKQRLALVQEWAENNQLDPETVNVSSILDHLDEKAAAGLEQHTTTLAEVIVDLKAQENLNQDLLQQSLQFVQMNLDMIAPSIEQMNYGNKQNANDPKAKRSVFDSKA